MNFFKIFESYIRCLKNIRYSNNRIYITDESGKKILHPTYLPMRGYEIVFKGDNNTVEIYKEKFCKNRHIKLKFLSSGNNVKVGKYLTGKWEIFSFEGNSKCEIGNNNQCNSIFIFLASNHLVIGNDCMISNNVRFWADSHSVLDNSTMRAINEPKKPTVIGNHVWLGERVTILKNAIIPDNCIVGIASVVTKAFNEQNCLIAGNPAQIKKHNINWHGLSPVTYNSNLENICR